MKLILGDSVDKLKELDDNSIDSIVTDPPYGLSFMGKKWDYDVPSQEIFEECLRVLKPGGYLLSFAGSRTYHRMAVRVEDAGFEIRDQIMWIYGSGFPKSHNIGKKVEQYEGWGTALKPAHEPIVMARKPLSEKTVAKNVLEWGTGGINIDDSRIGVESTDDIFAKNPHTKGGYGHGNASIYGKSNGSENYNPSVGRFPANIILDKEAGKILDEQTGELSSGFMKAGTSRKMSESDVNTYGHYDSDVSYNDTYGDTGGASRFFYCPKTSKKDRNEGVDNNHPTVKPTDLMLYLIRLVTPKGGTTLDPFMGSGSSGKAATRGGFDFVGIEREEEYMEIAEARIQYEIDNPYNEETKTRTNVKKEVKEKVNKFFNF